MQTLGRVLAFAGAVLLALAAWSSGLVMPQAEPECPQPKAATPATPSAYLTRNEIRLNGTLCLALDRAQFFARERTELAATEAAGGRPATDALPPERKIFVFLDDVKMPGEGRSVAVRPGAAGEREWVLVQFPLRSTADASSDAGRDWRAILGGSDENGTRRVRVGVAVSDGAEGAPAMRALIRDRAIFHVYDPTWVLVGGLGLVLLATGIGMSGWKTGLLRVGNATSPFSLARVQMAWWLVLTIGGFLFIWLVSGQWLGVVTSGMMALLGISATTGVAARLIEGSADGPPEKRPNFWLDIVSDENGVALHRIQLIAWTVVLGAIFVWTVILTFAFPDFDTNLLLLAGISGGTYLGFKFQETPAAPDPVEPADQDPAEPADQDPAEPADQDPAEPADQDPAR